MESTQSLQKKNVSDEVDDAAKQYADMIYTNRKSMSWIVVYAAFIAGASFNQPIEHSAKPENENGK